MILRIDGILSRSLPNGNVLDIHQPDNRQPVFHHNAPTSIAIEIDQLD